MTHLHSRFLAVLPRIQAHADYAFRFVRCVAKRSDWIAEAIALAWKWFAELEQRGRDAAKFISAIAAFAVRAVKCGRRVAGMERAKDAMNHLAQRRHGFAVETLPDVCSGQDQLTEALADNTVTPPPDAAAFRVDFPRWLETLSLRDRRLAEQLMLGERAHDTAERFGLSQARVSQVRRELSQDWERFHGAAVAA